MAEESPSPKSETPSPMPRQSREFWAVIAIVVVAFVCLTLLGVGLIFVLSRTGGSNSPVQNISNIGTVPPPPAPTPVPGIHRPYDAAKGQNERASAMDRTQPALPGLLASPTPQSGQRKLALTRADPPSPPSPALLPTPDPKKVYFRVRADPNSLYGGQKPLPMPVRYAPDAHGKVTAVFASREPAAAAAATPDTERFSYAPDVSFAESGIRGHALDIQLGKPRKTASVDGFRAPKGFQFFTTSVHISNQGAQPVVLRVDDLEVHDTEGLRYLPNPELVVGAWPAPSLAPAAELQADLSFLVPESSPLKELTVLEAPGQWAQVPLQAR